MIGYCMSKAGLEMLTKTSALELAPLGIRVNCVSPSVVDTNMYRYCGLIGSGENDQFMQRAAQNIPLQRVARVEEVAKAIIFLCSEKARRITGHVLKVDGGKTLTQAGFIPWYGMDVMSRRFEPDFMTKVNYWMSQAKKKVIKTRADRGTDEWIADV